MKHRTRARERQTKARAYYTENVTTVHELVRKATKQPGRPETNTSFNTPDIQTDVSNTMQHRTDHSS